MSVHQCPRAVILGSEEFLAVVFLAIAVQRLLQDIHVISKIVLVSKDALWKTSKLPVDKTDWLSAQSR